MSMTIGDVMDKVNYFFNELLGQTGFLVLKIVVIGIVLYVLLYWMGKYFWWRTRQLGKYIPIYSFKTQVHIKHIWQFWKIHKSSIEYTWETIRYNLMCLCYPEIGTYNATGVRNEVENGIKRGRTEVYFYPKGYYVAAETIFHPKTKGKRLWGIHRLWQNYYYRRCMKDYKKKKENGFYEILYPLLETYDYKTAFEKAVLKMVEKGNYKWLT